MPYLCSYLDKHLALFLAPVHWPRLRARLIPLVLAVRLPSVADELDQLVRIQTFHIQNSQP